MLWLKALHLIAMVCWFAGLLYLPRLFVYHAQAEDETSRARFIVMEQKLFWRIMTPSAALTLISGLWLWGVTHVGGHWLWWKLVLVAALILYHGWCWRRLQDFRHARNRYGHRYYRIANELPAVLLVGIVVLAVVKPF